MAGMDESALGLGHEDEVEEIERLHKTRGWRLDFGQNLERIYRADHLPRAVAAFQHSSIFIFLLYSLLSSGIYLLMPEGDMRAWIGLYSWVGVIILLAGVFSRLHFLDQWFSLYAGVGSFGAVALSVAVTGVVQDPVAGQLTQAAVMYAIVIIYGVVGLRFTHACIAGWLGGFVGGVLADALGGSVSWELLHRTFTGGSLLGMFLSYYAERRDRELFLQARLLHISHWRTENYAQMLDKLSRQDALTGLANRRHFDEALEQEWRRALRQLSPVAILMIDIDHFKHYNDSLGHPEGDRCLRTVASLLAAHARRPGELVARYGGEEFVMILPDTDHAQAVLQAENILGSIRRAGIPQPPGQERAHVSVSIGVSTALPTPDLQASELVDAADAALYEVKRSGRNGWRYRAPELAPLHVLNETARHRVG
ncbi:MAG: GGDEF domain-containing protein [Moraxellaceae bacterium]|nr:GGDEF domain-containing protein [Moraxellaceae bacterium]